MNASPSSPDAATSELSIGGTLIWYSSICLRQLWLMAHQINPDEDDPNLEYGRFLHETAYLREKRGFEVNGNRFDVVSFRNGTLVVAEIKKSSRALESTRLQLGHYLMVLEEQGINAIGELRFPEERRKQEVRLTDDLRRAVLRQRQIVREVSGLPTPPPPKRLRWCSKCAYAEMCWA
ncbi:MAG: CRISPR-associated protein Cas4 [Firmicutes bacterium]|nr:CRISPR-associated protein Cas4 [Alicyclobacillaceae bacterium]MCL6498048.1 CRISPR-associated protein Cas4 [Bacillota bacterium]